MSFGGGGGSVGVDAHTHTNVIGNGGALDDATLLNTTTLQNKIIVQAVALG
jgi:hypothetical protein